MEKVLKEEREKEICRGCMGRIETRVPVVVMSNADSRRSSISTTLSISHPSLVRMGDWVFGMGTKLMHDTEAAPTITLSTQSLTNLHSDMEQSRP